MRAHECVCIYFEAIFSLFSQIILFSFCDAIEYERVSDDVVEKK